jgi:uncharacterized protein
MPRFLPLLLLWVAGIACAQVPVPPLTGPVVDLTGTLTTEQRASLDAELRAFSARKGSQVAVLMVPTTKPESIEQYSIRVGEQWKIGRKGTDDGVVLVVAKDDRAVRIEVGYGLEGAIPDAYANRVIGEQIVPRFRNGDFHGGIHAATTTLMKLIEGEKLPEPARGARAPSTDHLQWLIWVLFAVMLLGGAVRRIFGRVGGSVIGGGAIGAVAWIVIGSAIVGLVAGAFAFLAMLAIGGGRGSYIGGPGWGGGTGSWGGGGGGFGGGGASGRW